MFTLAFGRLRFARGLLVTIQPLTLLATAAVLGGQSIDHEVTVRFRAVVGGAPFACGRSYPDIGTSHATITPSELRFCMHDLRLVGRDGSEVPLRLIPDSLWQYRDVAMLDFEDGTGPCVNGNAEVRDAVIGLVPAGDNVGLRFTVGVPFDLNHRDVTSQPSPLSLTSMFWAWNAGYKFLRLDLKTGDDRFWMLHLGTTGCSPGTTRQTIPTTCAHANRVSIALDAFDPSRDAVVLDIAALLERADVTLEFEAAAAGEAAGGFAEPDDIALVLHTSGTTSRPKIVPRSQRNVCASARHVRQTLQLTPNDRNLSIMPLFHIHGLIASLLAPLSAGSDVCCSPGFNALKFFGWMAEVKPTWYTAVPTMHQTILARAPKNADVVAESRLRFIRSSSSALPPTVIAELERVFRAPVVEAYGVTEAAHQMAPGSLERCAGPAVHYKLGDQSPYRLFAAHARAHFGSGGHDKIDHDVRINRRRARRYIYVLRGRLHPKGTQRLVLEADQVLARCNPLEPISPSFIGQRRNRPIRRIASNQPDQLDHRAHQRGASSGVEHRAGEDPRCGLRTSSRTGKYR